MQVIGLLLLFGVLFMIDYKDLLLGEQRNRKLAVYLPLLAMGLTISLLMATHHTPPSPTTIIEYLVTSLLSLI